MRRVLGFLVAALALAGGGFAAQAIDSARARAVRAQTGQAAVAAAQRAADGLSTVVTDLKLKVENAAANPRLVFALQGNVDERTMRDLWRTEDWWRPWRTEFKVYAVAIAGVRPDIVEGIEAADLEAEALLRRVRERGEGTAEIVIGKGWPYTAAATAVRVPGRETPPLLLVAKPIDEAVMGKLAEKSGGALLLTNGRTSLIDAGAGPDRAALVQPIGSETISPLFHGRDGAWSAASTLVAPGLWLWSFASASGPARDARAAAIERQAMLWAAALAIAAAALLFGLRRAPAIQEGSSTPTGSPPLPASDRRALFEGRVATSPAIAGVSTGARAPAGTTPLGSASTSISPAADGGAATAFASAPTAESAFGRYTLLDRLGEGGMAEVYTAVTFGAQGFRRKFVIKRLRAELARDSAAVDQFIDEANLASSMVHSNIVPVFDFGKVGEEYFMAQEYILGRDLGRVTRRSLERDGRPLPAEAVLHAAHETLRALEYAHTKTDEQGQPLGIVHRDVSPANVIVSARGEVKLFDFGIVKALGRVTKTESGVVKGNVSFMSPEQARGIHVDRRADLFSLGLMLYYCFAGRVLYAGNTTYELLVKAATGPGPDEYRLLDALPQPGRDLLRRALQVDPGQRFQTAREFGEALIGHVGGGAAELAHLMDDLFRDDFRAEETRFRTFNSSDASTATAPEPPLPQPHPRRS